MPRRDPFTFLRILTLNWRRFNNHAHGITPLAGAYVYLKYRYVTIPAEALLLDLIEHKLGQIKNELESSNNELAFLNNELASLNNELESLDTTIQLQGKILSILRQQMTCWPYQGSVEGDC